MAKIKSDLVVALAVVLVLNAMGSDEQKICGKSDGSGKTLWTGDCAGSQTFAVKEKKLVANFDFTGSAGEDQKLNFDIGGCKFAAAFSYNTVTNTAQLDIGRSIRYLPITAEITADKIVFKKEGESDIAVSCSVNFDSVSGSFKISVKYEPTKPEQLKDLKTTYEAPIFVDSEKAAASSPWLWSGIGVLILAGVVVICGTLWCFRGKFQRSNLDPPTKIKVKSSKKLKKEKKKQDSKSPKEFPLLDISNENLKVPEKSNSKSGKEKFLTEKIEIKTAKKAAPPTGNNDVMLKTAKQAEPSVGERPDAEAERRRLQEVQRHEAEERRAAEVQANRLAEVRRAEDEREANRLAEELRAAELQANRLAEERRAAELQANRLAEERRAAELQANRLAEERRAAELQANRLAEERRAAELQANRLAEELRAEDERQAVEPPADDECQAIRQGEERRAEDERPVLLSTDVYTAPRQPISPRLLHAIKTPYRSD